MSTHVMSVEIFGNVIRAETEGALVCLNDLFMAGNGLRRNNGKPALQLSAFLNSVTLKEYVLAATKEWGLPEDSFIKRIRKGNKLRTMVHISVAILAAEQISLEFHAKVHREFIEGQILKFRTLGATEFIQLNCAIDSLLPGREGKSNIGVFIQSATLLRNKILGKGATSESWNKASVMETQTRYVYESRLVDYLKMGFVKDFEHLKELIDKL